MRGGMIRLNYRGMTMTTMTITKTYEPETWSGNENVEAGSRRRWDVTINGVALTLADDDEMGRWITMGDLLPLAPPGVKEQFWCRPGAGATEYIAVRPITPAEQ